MFMGLILPLLAVAWKNNLLEDFKNKLRTASKFMILISIPLAFGTFAVAKDIMVAIGGNEYAESGQILAILMIAAVAVFFSALYGYTIVAMDMQKKTIIAYGINALISVPLYLILIQKFGGVGAAWTTVIVEVFIAIITALVVFRKIHERLNLILVGKTLIASTIMYLAVNYTSGYNLILRIILGIVVYGGLAVILRLVDKETVLMLKSTP
jgi:O-antigen/teichoic acid export membrane protein